jgi:NAD(P)-dependent dehydrogenase (short-subunit alcohol dehydrogenase family)
VRGYETHADVSIGNDLSGATALVTGGSNGIGRGIVRALVDRGARVAVLDLAEHDAWREDDRVVMIAGDVADPDVATGAVDQAIRRFGALDILVNDAAAYPDALITTMPVDDWRRVFDVNVTGPFCTMQAFARHRIAVGGGGSIVNITTGSVQSPRPAGGAYSASKAALETLTKVAALELGPHGIRANVVAPGYVDVRGETDAFPDRASDELRDALVASIPLAKAGRAHDIAHAVLFLCSPAAGHITGAVLHVDGGSLAGRFTLPPSADAVRG